MRLPFSKRPSTKDATGIANAQTTRDVIKMRLALAEQAVKERHAAVRRFALDGADDDALDKAEAALRAAQDRARTLADALADADTYVREAEQRRDAAEAQKRRGEVATEIEKVAERLGEVGSEFAGLMQKMAALTERAAALTPDASGLHSFCSRALIEIPESAELLSQVLRGIATATRSGSAPAPLPQSVPQAQPTCHVPPPAMTRVFAVKPIKWLDATGALRLQPPHFDIDLEPALAARAIEIGAAIEITDPRRRQLHGSGRIYLPNAEHCVSLTPGDDSEPEPRHELVPGVPIEPLQEQRHSYAVAGNYGA